MNLIDIIVYRPERSKADSNRFQEGNQKSEANDMMREIINESSLKTINSPMVKRIPPRVSNKIKKLQANEIANSKHRYVILSISHTLFLTLTIFVLPKCNFENG